MMIPLSLDARDSRLVFVGGGKAVTDKINFLARLARDQGLADRTVTEETAGDKAAPRIRVIAPLISVQLHQLTLGHPFAQLELVERRWEPADLHGANLVFAFTDDAPLNQHIALLCRQNGIWCNATGVRGQGGFSSPASLVRGKHLVSVASLPPHNPRSSRELLGGIDGYLLEAATNQVAPPAVQDGADRSQKSLLPGSAEKALTPHADPALLPDPRHFMPFMISLGRVLVFAGERGEGLQKTEKLALYARELAVIAESDPEDWVEGNQPPEAPLQAASTGGWQLDFPVGPVRWVAEPLSFAQGRSVPVLAGNAAWHLNPLHPTRLSSLLEGVDYVCSDLADAVLNRTLHLACGQRGIRHTVVDTKEFSDSWFMSLVDKGSLLAGISSRGGCAFYTRRVREELDDEFAGRATMAAMLTALRSRLPPEARESGLAAVYGDGEFRRLMAEGQEAMAEVRAQAVLADQANRLAGPAPALLDHSVDKGPIVLDRQLVDRSRQTEAAVSTRTPNGTQTPGGPVSATPYKGGH